MRLPDPLPETLLLRPSRIKWALMALTSFGFVAIAVWLMQDRQFVRWMSIVLFGVVGVVRVIGIGSYLKLGPEGVEQSTTGGKVFYRGEDVSNFSWIRMSFNSFIMFDQAAGPDGRKASSRALTDTFGLKPDALMALLTAYQTRAQKRMDGRAAPR